MPRAARAPAGGPYRTGARSIRSRGAKSNSTGDDGFVGQACSVTRSSGTLDLVYLSIAQAVVFFFAGSALQ